MKIFVNVARLEIGQLFTHVGMKLISGFLMTSRTFLSGNWQKKKKTERIGGLHFTNVS